MKVRSLKEDDRMILWEGVDTLTKRELQASTCLTSFSIMT